MSSTRRVGIATGAARGMGLTCARRMVGSGDVLFLVDGGGDGSTYAAASLSTPLTRCVPVQLDVTDVEGVGALRDAVAREGALQAVAHAAGVSPTMADWQTVVRVDLVGSALLVDALESLVVPGT